MIFKKKKKKSPLYQNVPLLQSVVADCPPFFRAPSYLPYLFLCLDPRCLITRRKAVQDFPPPPSPLTPPPSPPPLFPQAPFSPTPSHPLSLSPLPPPHTPFFSLPSVCFHSSQTCRHCRCCVRLYPLGRPSSLGVGRGGGGGWGAGGGGGGGFCCV